MNNTVTALPTIVRFLGTSDSGEFGNATCPHCGALGRYVSTFVCDDGTQRGAMAGCIRLFPISRIAKVAQALATKERDYAKKDWTLPSWDLKKLEAIEQFYAGVLDERDVLSVIANEESRAKAYRQRKHGGRR